jgi:hypothetical protein
MKKTIKTSLLSAFVLILGSLIYLLLFGKFFVFSPLHIGFSKFEFPNVIIYAQKGSSSFNGEMISALVPQVEKFHDLSFIRKPVLYIFRDKKSYLRRSLSKARFCAFYNGTIVISPWAQKEAEEGAISLEIYLKHELSHVLLFQHKGILTAFKYPKWLLEGIAMYSADQMGTFFYPNKEETYQLIERGNFMPPRFFSTGKEEQIKLDVQFRPAFIYSEFACMVEYMIMTFGKDKFLDYMKGLLTDSDHDRVFKAVYGIDFDTFQQNFIAHVHDSARPQPDTALQGMAGNR